MALTPEDLAVLQGVLAERAHARAAMVRRWLKPVLRWARGLGGPGVDPEDVAHDVFVVVLTKLHALRDLGAFEPWLFGITRRVLKTHRRRARKWQWGWFGAEELADESPGLDRVLADRQVAERVQAALARVPERQREVLTLCDLEGRTAQQAAELLGVSVGTVKSRLRLGRQRLRRAPGVRLLLAELSQAEAG